MHKHLFGSVSVTVSAITAIDAISISPISPDIIEIHRALIACAQQLEQEIAIGLRTSNASKVCVFRQCMANEYRRLATELRRQ